MREREREDSKRENKIDTLGATSLLLSNVIEYIIYILIYRGMGLEKNRNTANQL